MKNSKLWFWAIVDVVGILAYISLVAFILFNTQKLFGQAADDFTAPIMFLLTFIISAVVTGGLFLGRPIYLFLTGSRSEAIKLFFYTLGSLLVITLAIFVARISLGPGAFASPIYNSWLTYTDSTTGISFKYPKDLPLSAAIASPAQYIRPVDWPPKVQILNQPWSCTEAGNENVPAGQTKKETIDGKNYCVTRETQGAAGSLYTMYAYAFPWDDGTMILTFSLQFPQCANYPEPKVTECQTERTAFDIDSIVGKIAESAQ